MLVSVSLGLNVTFGFIVLWFLCHLTDPYSKLGVKQRSYGSNRSQIFIVLWSCLVLDYNNIHWLQLMSFFDYSFSLTNTVIVLRIFKRQDRNESWSQNEHLPNVIISFPVPSSIKYERTIRILIIYVKHNCINSLVKDSFKEYSNIDVYILKYLNTRKKSVSKHIQVLKVVFIHTFKYFYFLALIR